MISTCKSVMLTLKSGQAREQVLQAKQEIDRLSTSLASAEQSASEAQRLREEVRRLETQHVSALNGLKAEASNLQAAFTATERERDQLLQEVSFCRPSLACLVG